MDFLKKNFDIVCFISAVGLYALQSRFLPVLVLTFIFLWYRRELIWRVKHKKVAFSEASAHLDGSPNFLMYLAFWFFGIFIIPFCTIVEMFVERVIWSESIFFFKILDKFHMELFDTTLRYIYIGHVASEPEIGKELVRTLAEIGTESNVWPADMSESSRVQLRINGLRGLLSVLFIYTICFGRLFIIQPFYAYCLNQQKVKFKWSNIRISHIAVFLLLYWMFFYLPIHQSDCPIGRSGVHCSNLGGEVLKYIAFPARVMLYWSVMLFFINHFFNDILNKEQV